MGTICVDTAAIAVGVSVATEHEEWVDGHFMVCGEKLGGIILQTVFLVGAAVSTLGLLCSMLCTSSRFLYGMACVGTVPKVFAKLHPKYDTPWVALTFNSMFVASCTVLDFSELAELEMWLYCASTILKFGSFYALRIKESHLERPYTVPLRSRPLLLLFISLPIGLCLILMYLATLRTQIIGLATCAIAAAVYRSAPAREHKLPVAIDVIAD